MNARIPLPAAPLVDQLADLQARIRQHPADAGLRAHLFQLLALLGDWPRAEAQLQTCLKLNPESATLVRTYASALRAEQQRARVFAGVDAPEFPVDLPWLHTLVDALHAEVQGHADEAALLRQTAWDAAPASPGVLTIETADGVQTVPHAWIADGDSRLGPVLECFTGAHYAWLPFAVLRSVRLAPPTGVCDLVWQHVALGLADGREIIGLVPVRYPLTDPLPHDAGVLARHTDWLQVAPEHYHGIGQRMWITDAGEYALLDLRTLQAESAEAAIDG
ncbi:type VI secretion system accessory protein TagJ [Andreprevotia chitinilytica]|uniref:type VI secretion system accessory protein TagJ n=1 Tax=Andreprevotia chitinilytica TaxID=396808 RepID=UPI000557F8D6|nr:type VI secretion system accessory protein TagJ [Andreprevotia chitinilytica]